MAFQICIYHVYSELGLQSPSFLPYWIAVKLRGILLLFSGVCPGFLKGGPISLGTLKKGHQILKGGGSNGLIGGVQYISLPRMTNLAYLDAK